MAALRCYSPKAIIAPGKISSKATIKACSDNYAANSESKKAPSSVSFFSKVHKVYESKNTGILCYTDENGELVCEGQDEGPRLTRQNMEKLSTGRKLKTERNWWESPLQIAKIDWSYFRTTTGQGKKN